jgi:hypothetical protein
LYKIGKLGPNEAAYFFPGASPLCIICADPSEAICYVLPSTFHAAEAAAKSNVIGMRPQSEERSGSALYELLLGSFKVIYESLPFRVA